MGSTTILRVVFLSLVAFCFSCGPSSGEKPNKQNADSLQKVKQKEEAEQKLKNTQVEEARRLALVQERNSVLTFVSTDQPTFRSVFLGGFRNIRFVLSNHYDYPLEQVVLTVHYIKANGNTIKTETITVPNMPARSHRELKAPDYTAAGTKLKVTIETVTCKAIQLCYDHSKTRVPGDKDPYRCL